MSKTQRIAILQARQAVLEAPDRETLMTAYRYYYDLITGKIRIQDSIQRPVEQDDSCSAGWLSALQKYYG